mgnify:CR=1 FL=1
METYNWVVILSIHDESVVENVPVDLAWVRDVLRQRDDLFIGRVYANINIAHVLKIVVINNRHHIDAIDAMVAVIIFEIKLVLLDSFSSNMTKLELFAPLLTLVLKLDTNQCTLSIEETVDVSEIHEGIILDLEERQI